jgi:hypothetical protein
LKLRYYEASDGAKQFLGWRDSERNEDCGFGIHADGSTRCLPTGAIYAAIYFSDAGCTNALAYAAKTTPPTKYASKFDGVGARIYSATPYNGTVYSGSPSSCNASTAAAAALKLFTVGAEVASSAFVSATAKVAP